MKHLSGVISISSAIERELRSHGIVNIHSIPNGVDSRKFAPGSVQERKELRRRFGWRADEFVVLFVGAICSRKRPEWILEAADLLVDEFPSLRVVFLGPEREHGHLVFLRSCVSARLQNRVEFIEHDPDVEFYYKASDIYCLPSKQEGMPNSVLEAMASGLPCVVTKISGSEELVEDGLNGFQISSPGGARDALRLYLTNPGLARQHGMNGRVRVLQAYSTKIVFQRHMDLFHEIIRREKGHPV